MRKSTLLWLTLALFCGIALFLTSQKTHDRKEKLAVLETAVGKEEESIRVLQAEWGYLNQPARLEKLAAAYLHLAPLKAAQFARLEEIALREIPEAEIEKQPSANVIPAKAIQKPVALNTRKYPHPNMQGSLASPRIPEGEGIIRASLPPLPLGEDRGEGTSAQKPATKTAPTKQKSATNTRQFGDLMKSLGVD